MGHPEKTFFLFLIVNFIFACLSQPITSDVQDIIIKENGNICFTGKLHIKLTDGEKEIVVPKDVKPQGTCYNGEELSPEIIYEWPGTNEKYKNTVVIKWKHENNESYINFVGFAVTSENTGVLHSAIMSDLHELEVTDGYRWHSDDEVYIKKKTEPNKSVSLSGAYLIGKNIIHQLSAAKTKKSSITSEPISNIKRRKHHDTAVHRPHSTQYNYLTKTSIQYSKPDIPTPSSDKPDTTIPYPDDGAKACIAASLTIKVHVPYKKSDDSDAIADLVIPTTKTHMDSGNCDSKGGNFEIVYKWNWDDFKSKSVRKPGTENMATIAWTKDPGTKQYSISSMIFNIKTNDVNLFEDAKNPAEVLSVDSGPIQLLTSSQGECSRCKNGQSIKDAAGTSTIDVLGAYELEGGNDGSSFSTQVAHCPADIPPNIPTPSSDKPDTTIPNPDDATKTCIAASLTVKVQMPYKKVDDSDGLANLIIPTTKTHMDSGKCDSKGGNFEIVYKWNWDDFTSNPARKPGTDNTATIKWTKDPGTKQYSISSMIFIIKTNDPNLFEDAKKPDEVLTIDSGQIGILTSSQGECSRCKHGQSIKDTAGTSTIDVSGAYELEAENDGTSFSTQVAPCPADIPPNIPTPPSDKPDTTIRYPDDSTKTCIAASLTVKVQVPYKKLDDSAGLANLVIPTTKTHIDSGKCDSQAGNFEIVYNWNWDDFTSSNPVRKPGTDNVATIKWTKDPVTSQYSITSMNFNIKTNDPNLFEDAKIPDEVLSIDSGPIQLLTSSQGECSLCKHGQSIKDAAGTSTIDVSGAYELEAGNDGSSFSTQVAPCPADIPPNIPTPSSDAPDSTIPYPDDSTKTCIAASLTVKVQVPYKKADDSDGLANLVIPTTKTHMDSGKCDSKGGNFEIVYKWNWDDFTSNSARKPGTDNTATIKWTKDPSTKQYSISSMIFNIKTNDANLFEDAKDPDEVLAIDSGPIQLLTSSQGECSRCKHGQSTKDTAGTSTIDVSGAYELEAENDGSSFSTQVAPCPADIPPNIPTPPSDKPDSTIPNPDDATKTCIAASLTVKVQMPYKKVDDTGGLANLVIPTTKTHMDSGKCDTKGGNFEIVYKWNWDDFTSNPARKPGTDNTATIKWTDDTDTNQYSISSMTFSIKTNDPILFEDAKEPDEVLAIDSGPIKILTSSKGQCSRCEHGHLTTDPISKATINVSGAYELEAGNDGASFSNATSVCSEDLADNNNNVSDDDGSPVGAIAGGTIAGLVVVIAASAFGFYYYRKHKNHES